MVRDDDRVMYDYAGNPVPPVSEQQKRSGQGIDSLMYDEPEDTPCPTKP